MSGAFISQSALHAKECTPFRFWIINLDLVTSTHMLRLHITGGWSSSLWKHTKAC